MKPAAGGNPGAGTFCAILPGSTGLAIGTRSGPAILTRPLRFMELGAHPACGQRGRKVPAFLRWRAGLLILLASCNPALPAPQQAPGAAGNATESIDQALCRIIEESAARQRLGVEFVTRLIWQESSFRPGARSPAGAQGVAQFMPKTAAERGLADPFDPEQAIPKAVEFLAELLHHFGNPGLAAAAYNGGPTRVANWLNGQGSLPAETRNYVAAITGRSVENWAAQAKEGSATKQAGVEPDSRKTCLQLSANLRGSRGRHEDVAIATAFAPWGVQLAGNFSKTLALASYSRVRRSYGQIIGDMPPMIIGTRLRSRGTRAFYRVRVPAETRAAAEGLCNRIRAAGGSCIVLRS
jgi:hypothetical protein